MHALGRFPIRAGFAWRLAAVLAAGASLCACASVTPQYSIREPAQPPKPAGPPGYKVGAPYQVGGIWYVPREQPDYDQTGVASWYGDEFHLKPTADGEVFDKDTPSAAHTTLPLPSLVEVTNLDNGRKLVVRVNDRGPFVGGRIIDLSHEAARQLGYDRAGLARVRVRYVGRAPLLGEETLRYARYQPPAKAAPSTREAVAPPPYPNSPTTSDVVLTSGPLPPATPVAMAELAPLPAPPRPVASSPAAETVRTGFRVQAGAFSNLDNAHKAAAVLAAAGHAEVEPFSRGGVTLWRVMLDGVPDQDAAEALREKAADAGFPDARVIAPS